MKENPGAQKATDSIRNHTLDIMKLILSVFVVMIHAEVDIGILQPFLRVAVPLFFITSSYFFFQKITACGSDEKRRNVLIRFVKRNMILYGFWFVMLLPVTLYIRDWFSGSALESVTRFLQSFLFNSTFRASWYIMALTIGMCISLWLSGHLSPGVHILVTVPVYLLCCLFTNYYGLAARSSVLMNAYNIYVSVFRSLCNSFPASLLWLSIGRYVSAEKGTFKKTPLYALTAVSAGALVVEYLLVSFHALPNGNDAYVMLVPLCIGVFLLVKDANFKGRIAVSLGRISTVIYASHATVITVVGAVLRRLIGNDRVGLNWTIFAVSLAICVVIYLVIAAMERHRYFRWLRCAY